MFFKDNLALISEKNPDLAQNLSQIFIVQAEENIEVYMSECGDYVLSYDGLILDDMLAPAELAKKNFEENVPSDYTNNDVVIVFGLGAGYLFKHAVTFTNAKVVLIEPKIDILRYCTEYVDFSNEFAKDNVYIFSDIKLAEFQIKKLYMQDNSHVSVIYPEAYLQLTPDILGEFQNNITKFITKD